MSNIKYIDKDFVRFTVKREGREEFKTVLVFGDKVEVLEENTGKKLSRIRALELFDGTLEGTVKGNPFRTREKGVLKFSMIDVQQGDGMILETPPDENHETRLMFIDSGDNKLFARHIAARYNHRKSTNAHPLEVDLILITHGDADHFEGLRYIRSSETQKGLYPNQRLYIHPKRIYHNGLVKGPSSLKETERLGRTVERNGKPLMIVDLYDDPRNAPEKLQNSKFKAWVKCINHWEKRGDIELKRVAYGMNSKKLFGFLGSDIKVDIQGPFTSKIKDPKDNKRKDALPFFTSPKKSAVIHVQEDGAERSKSYSTSHTINGHSIALRLTYGNVRFNLTGDLNQESMEVMRNKINLKELESEIIKAPHHGSADFDFKALQAMKPVVSLISSGDESANKEHIHPRATLVAALGKVSRGNTGIVLCTELAAFFAKRDYSHERPELAKYYKDDEPITKKDLREFFKTKRGTKESEKLLQTFYAFERKNFGIIHIRTDGERVLVFTHSGKKGMREAYRFTVDKNHKIRFAHDVKTG